MPTSPLPPSDGAPESNRDRLDSWKEIAAHLGRGVTTVQRWEEQEGLPIRRLPHAKKGSVFASRRELDAWLEQRAVARRPPAIDAPSVAPPEVRPRMISTARAILVVTAVVLSASVAWWARMPGAATASPTTTPTAANVEHFSVAPLLNSADEERAPSLSPDGRQVAFAASRGGEGGVYVRTLPDGPTRLLWPFDADLNPVYITKWSPAGDRVAFNSLEGHDTYGLHVVSAVGGPSRRLTSMAGVGICWAPHGDAIVFADRTSATEPFSLFSIHLTSGERARLTMPQPGAFGDTACSWSPDGTRLAFVRFATRYEADVMVLDAAQASAPVRIARGTGGIDDLDWSADGQTIVFANLPGLREVPSDGSAPSTPIAGLVGVIGQPSFSRATAPAPVTLAYQLGTAGISTSVWHADRASDPPAWAPEPEYESEFPSVSHDGQHVAYVRGGEVWTATTSGRDHRQVTFHAEPGEGTRIVTGPRWSPDNRRIVFSVPVDHQRDLYIADRDGANSRRLTFEPSLDDNPSWSRDGQWIYFRSDRNGRNHIWKIAATGGTAIQVTEGEAWQGLESVDGATLFFVRSTAQPGLWQMPTRGGSETLVIPEVTDSRWDVTAAGIIYVDAADTGSPTLRLYATGTTGPGRALGSLPASAALGFSVTPDARTVFWARKRAPSSDIMIATR